MLKELYPIAVQAGVDADRFWVMHYDEIITQMEANREKRLEDMKEQAYMDYRRAQLMSYSVNNPQKMPKIEKVYPFLTEEKVTTPEEQSKINIQKEQDYMRMKMAQIKAARAIKSEKSE